MEKITSYFTSKTMQIRIITFWSIGASLLWIALFSLGLLVDSKPFRICVTEELDLYALLKCIFTYTPTNIAILCLTSAYLGGCASKLVIHNLDDAQPNVNPVNTTSRIYMNERPMSAMVRGIVIYFAYIAGVCVADATLFNEPTQTAYIKSAGIISLLSFLVGYDPTLFHSFINVAEKVSVKEK
ncbi:hypothetical protein OX284_006750 [Flavobacterium sp. SUN046]|uniref:hypothetical protein n=1 Tax=Flavobacterium sp. SUN046 TaxID=3002440 RepID=UPI002DB584B9|nr:hypothetical protein [Flavobacterium sp. SUN046]MEC4049122.1 hypothetical protein [Flavobacterium sp. SUN046]